MEDKKTTEVEIKKEHPVKVREEKSEDIVPVEIEDKERLNIELTETKSELSDIKNKYMRLYAEFENYKKMIQKDKEALLRYGTESLMQELLPILDNLEMAIEHTREDNSSDSLLKGVGLTLKEFKKVLTNYGVQEIKSSGKTFDPVFHHAMSQVEREDIDEKMVVEEFRKGYMLKDRVLRPSLVAVSKKVGNGENKLKEES